jgi:hypothetical protein
MMCCVGGQVQVIRSRALIENLMHVGAMVHAGHTLSRSSCGAKHDAQPAFELREHESARYQRSHAEDQNREHADPVARSA